MMGAYTWASASTFNFFPKTNVHVVDTDKQVDIQEISEMFDFTVNTQEKQAPLFN